MSAALESWQEEILARDLLEAANRIDGIASVLYPDMKPIDRAEKVVHLHPELARLAELDRRNVQRLGKMLRDSQTARGAAKEKPG